MDIHPIAAEQAARLRFQRARVRAEKACYRGMTHSPKEKMGEAQATVSAAHQASGIAQDSMLLKRIAS